MWPLLIGVAAALTDDYRKLVQFGGLHINYTGHMETHVKASYYASSQPWGRTFTFANIGNCLELNATAPFTYENLPTCTTLPRNSEGDYLNGTDVYQRLFGQEEPVVFDPDNVTHPSWLRYPDPPPNWTASSTPFIHHSVAPDIIRWDYEGSLWDVYSSCRQTPSAPPLVTRDEEDGNVFYRFNVSANFISPFRKDDPTLTTDPPTYNTECNVGQYAVAVSMRTNAMLSFGVAGSGLRLWVDSVEYEECSSCRDRFSDSDKYYHTCTGISRPYRLKINLKIDAPTGMSTSALGISAASDIKSLNNGCYGFPQGAEWTHEGGVTSLSLYSECLSMEKYFMYDCSRFHTCDVNGDGYLDEGDHNQFDYSVSLRLTRCLEGYHDCLNSEREHSDAECAANCYWTVMDNEVDLPVDISVQHGECPPNVGHGRVVERVCHEHEHWWPYVLVAALGGAAVAVLFSWRKYKGII